MAQTTLEEIKGRQQVTWSSGDYGRVAWLTVPLADVLCEAVDLEPGSKVLDVATGTGHLALAAARRFCDVTGIDYVPALVEIARRRAAAENLEIDFRTDDAEDLSLDDASFDYVLSVLGVMFTTDHPRAARELTRVCRPGGTIGLLSWTQTGFIGEMLRTVSSHVPPPPGIEPPTRWGTEDYVRELLGAEVAEVSFHTGAITQRFPSAEVFADFFVEHYGPTRKAHEALAPEERDGFRRELVELARRHAGTDDGPAIWDWDYLIASARRV